jgi:hypothetical protein
LFNKSSEEPTLGLKYRSCFVLIGICFSGTAAMPDLNFIRTEFGRLRTQVGRQRREVLDLQQAGIPSAAAEDLLRRMRATLASLYARLRAEPLQDTARRPAVVRWVDGEMHHPAFPRALEQLRRELC